MYFIFPLYPLTKKILSFNSKKIITKICKNYQVRYFSIWDDFKKDEKIKQLNKETINFFGKNQEKLNKMHNLKEKKEKLCKIIFQTKENPQKVLEITRKYFTNIKKLFRNISIQFSKGVNKNVSKHIYDGKTLKKNSQKEIQKFFKKVKYVLRYFTIKTESQKIINYLKNGKQQKYDQKAQQQLNKNISSIIFVKGFIGDSNVCNGYYKKLPIFLKNKVVYRGTKLQNSEIIVLVGTSERWFFTYENSIKGQLSDQFNTLKKVKPLLAFVELNVKTPLNVQELSNLQGIKWKIQSKRPGRYLSYEGLLITDQLPSINPPTDALVIFEQKLSSFKKIQKKIRQTYTYRYLDDFKTKIYKTQTMRKVKKASGLVQEGFQNIYYKYEETQNPYIWKIRDTVDKMSMETESGSGISAIRQDFDPDFWPDDFILIAETDIIPIFIQKYLEGDMTWLKLACTSEGEAVCFASIQERIAQDVHWDQTILWINEPILDCVLLENKRPLVRFSTTIQHIDCSRNSKGEIIDGGPTKISNSLFVFTVTPHPENEERVGFPWQIRQLSTHRIQALM